MKEKKDFESAPLTEESRKRKHREEDDDEDNSGEEDSQDPSHVLCWDRAAM